MEILKLFLVLSIVVTIATSKVLEVNTRTIKTSANGERNITIRSMARIYDDDICEDDSYTGVCLNTTECSARGGSASENDYCWNAGDVCCKIIAKCPSISNPCAIRNSGTTVLNEAGISDYRRTLRFFKGENTCQLRLDFDEFELAQPDMNGDCSTESMQIVNSRTKLSICGVNNKQHLYLEFGYQPYIDVIMRIRNASKYKIRSTLIGCDSEYKAPSNCLQYYTEYDGTVRSFNFPNAQLSNLEYSICVSVNDGIQSIQWKPCTESTEPFFISGTGFDLPLSSPDCQKDWIQVYGRDRYCGQGFPTITSSAKPFLLNVRFDQVEGFGVTMPTDPSECAGTFPDPNTGGEFVCASDGGSEGECTCVYNPPEDFDFGKDVDICNTGFCLEYGQQW